MHTAITNPRGALYNVSDYRTGRDNEGHDLQFGGTALPFRANATVTKGQALMFVAPTETVPLSVSPGTTAVLGGDPWMFAGVALNSAAAGEDVFVLRDGITTVKIDTSDTPAASNVLLVPDATTGEFATAASAAAGTAVVGVVLGPEIGSTEYALAYVGFVPVETVTDT